MNNVVIHQDAIDKLAFAPGLIKEVEDRAQKIVALTQASVGGSLGGTEGYFDSASSLTVDQDVGYQMQTDGSAVVGIVDGYDGTDPEKSKALRIARNPNLFPKWLLAATAKVFSE